MVALGRLKKNAAKRGDARLLGFGSECRSKQLQMRKEGIHSPPIYRAKKRPKRPIRLRNYPTSKSKQICPEISTSITAHHFLRNRTNEKILRIIVHNQPTELFSFRTTIKVLGCYRVHMKEISEDS